MSGTAVFGKVPMNSVVCEGCMCYCKVVCCDKVLHSRYEAEVLCNLRGSGEYGINEEEDMIITRRLVGMAMV